jgi:8-amino-7-oxononanoate synthase
MLDALKQRDRYRQLAPAGGADFASNDYLGLANSTLLRDAAQNALANGAALGAGASRLLRGNAEEHVALEKIASCFFQTEAALFMGGGFVANMAIFSTLPHAGDLILHDELVHASAHEGMRLGRAATQSFAHNNAVDAASKAKAWRAENPDGRIWIAVEAVYSMHGDLAPLGALYALAQEMDAILVVDEAHATGVFGKNGRGLAHEIAGDPRVLSLHTCGKALGASGALVCGAKALIDTLINKARGFIFATAPSPLMAAIVSASLVALEQGSDLPKRAQDQMAATHAYAKEILGLDGFQSQIMPIVIGADAPTMALAQAMQQRGYDIRGIRPPTVPKKSARLRISLTLNTDLATNREMQQVLADEMEKAKL